VFVYEQRKHTARLCALLLAACAAVAAAQPPPRVAVVDLLRTLIAAGVDVLYSSELVPADLDAPDTLPQGDPMARVVAALAVNHLTVQHTSGGGYVVTRAVAPSVAPAPPAPPAGAAPTVAVVAGSAPREPTLDEVSVFASRYEFTTTNTPGEPIEFDQRDIEQMPGAKADSVRALRAAPGLATNLSAQPYVRGALRDDVLVEFDGIALAEPFHFRSFQSPMSIFNPSTVNRADVFTGGFPVNYGNRSGGVIDLTPRSVESGYEYGLGASLLSYELETVGRSDSQPIEWLLVARLSSDPSVLQRLLSEFGEPKFSDVVGRIRWSIDPASSLTLGWLILDDQVNLSSNSSEEHASARSQDYYTWLRWDWTPSATVQSYTSVAVADTERNNSGTLLLPGLAVGNMRGERSFSDISLRSEWSYTPSAELSWKFGGDFTRENADLVFLRQEVLGDPIAASFGRPADASITSRQSPHSSTWGLFSSAHRRWQAFEAEIGVRVDGQAYQGFGARSQMSPRINVRYDVSDRWHAYGSWGQFTQAQRVDEYRAEANQVTPDPANRAVHSIAGLTHESLGATTWRVEAYRHHWSSISPYFDNALGPISILPQLEPDRVLIVPADADAAGIEISAQRSFTHGLSASGTYSFSKVTDDVNGREIVRSWDQTHSANFGIAWTGHRTSVSAFLAWHSGWPRTPVAMVPATLESPAYYAVGARNSARWESYFSADLRLSTSLPLRSGDLSLWLDATNLTNRSNYCCVDLNAISSPAGVSTMPNAAWSPRVVNVGFTWRVRRPR
jgi:outer membrane cobalamin receptor